jgi:hypothetical protein
MHIAIRLAGLVLALSGLVLVLSGLVLVPVLEPALGLVPAWHNR